MVQTLLQNICQPSHDFEEKKGSTNCLYFSFSTYFIDNFFTEEVESTLARKVDQSLLFYMWPLVFHYMIFQFPYMEREIPTQIFT